MGEGGLAATAESVGNPLMRKLSPLKGVVGYDTHASS